VRPWQEFEELATPEARLARCIDKSDALIQHDIAAIETWDQATSTLEDGGCRDAGG
jgi:HD domain